MGGTSTTDHPDAVAFVAKYENDLAHYGIPGMKWGVRRSQATLDRLAGRTPAESKKIAEKREKKWADKEKEREVIRKTKRKAKLEVKKAKIEGKAALEKAKIDRKVEEARHAPTAVEKARLEEYNRKTSTKLDSAKSLSDGELSARVKRMSMEQKYSDLVKSRKPKKASDVVKSFLAKEAKKHAKNYATAFIDQQVKNLVGESAHKTGEKIIDEAASTKPKKEKTPKPPKSPKPPKPPKPPRQPRPKREKKAHSTRSETGPQAQRVYYQTATRLDTPKELERKRK